MDVARLNMSHGDHDAHLATLHLVREEAERRNQAVAVLLDLQGPKIRVGTFAGGAADLLSGDLCHHNGHLSSRRPPQSFDVLFSATK